MRENRDVPTCHCLLERLAGVNRTALRTRMHAHKVTDVLFHPQPTSLNPSVKVSIILNQTGLEMNLQVDPQLKQKRPQQRMIDSLNLRMDGV